LAFCLAIGFGFSAPLHPIAHSAALRAGVVIIVMTLMGWTLQPRSVVGVVRRPLASILAITINIFVVPLLAWPSLWLLPRELAGGLIVASLIPCTLASASVWTRAAGGDEAVAMITTVVTNLVCFLVVPAGLSLMIGEQAVVSANSQMSSLLWQVVLPLVAGQSLRQLGLSRFADRHKATLSILAQVGILLMVLLGGVISAERMPTLSGAYTGTLLLTLLIALLVHTTALTIGYHAGSLAKVNRPQKIAIAIAGGQKTLMVGLQVALYCGFSVMPMVMYHVGQLFIDTLVVRYFNRRETFR